jgi:hypothetical protein
MTACLVDDPPPYTAPSQTPPRLDYHDALPLLDQVIIAKTGDTLNFSIPVASEDAGDVIQAFLLLDYSGGRATPLDADNLPPSTLDNTKRKLSLSWTVGIQGTAAPAPGCHRLTLRVTHRQNIKLDTFPDVVDSADLAEAYWWVNVDSDPTLGNTLVDCPLASRGTQ